MSFLCLCHRRSLGAWLQPFDVTITQTHPGFKEIRSAVNPSRRARSTLLGVTLFVISASLYIAAFVMVAMLPQWWMKIIAMVFVAGMIPALFVIGHDACHQSLTPRGWLNRLLGRLSFLPSLHVYSAWEYGHNGLHHGWTNLSGKDPVWAPFTKENFDRLPRRRQILERIYRTPLGVGLHYLLEMWIGFGITRRHARVPGSRFPRFFFDRLLIILFIPFQAAVLILLSNYPENSTLPALAHHSILISMGILLPFVYWNWFMGFVIFQHHTHPRVAWFDDEKEWTFYSAQVKGVVHVQFPWIVEKIFHNIFDHTAHHVDTSVPLYNLPDAQRDLESTFSDDVVIARWTYRDLLNTCRTCQLYDYRNHQWLDFQGRPTSETLRR